MHDLNWAQTDFMEQSQAFAEKIFRMFICFHSRRHRSQASREPPIRPKKDGCSSI